VIDRCNLTILEEPGHEDLADFLATHRIEVVASLPCYLEDNVEQQRGKGSFAASIRGPAAAERARLWCGRQAGCSSTSSSIRRDHPCHHRRPLDWRWLTGNTSDKGSASSSTSCSPWPTCRSSALARSSSRAASSTSTCNCCVPPTAKKTSTHVMCRNLLSSTGRAISTTATSTRARAANRQARQFPSAHQRHRRGRTRGSGDPCRRTLLRLHRRAGIELRWRPRRRAGPGAKLWNLSCCHVQ
jgi:hypothetical protein